MKTNRQSVILKIISEENIETQSQLIEALAIRNVPATQATLSRDIRELHLIKEAYGNGNYRYVHADKVNSGVQNEKLLPILRDSIISIDIAMNIVVIKTTEGMASGVASAVDKYKFDNIVGTLAGDDTIFVAMKNSDSAEKLVGELKSL